MNRTKFEKSINNIELKKAIEKLLSKYNYVIRDIDNIRCKNQQYHIIVDFANFYIVSSVEEAKEIAKKKIYEFISYKAYDSFPFEYKKYIVYECKFHNNQKIQSLIKENDEDNSVFDSLIMKFNENEEEIYKFLTKNECIDWELFVPFIVEKEEIGEILNSYDSSIWLLDGGFIGWREK